MPRRVKVCQQAVRSVVEMLEHRLLLTTVMGGGVDPVTGEPIANQLVYYDRNKHNVVISVGGNTTAEFIFARVPDMSDAIASLGDFVPPPPPNPPVPVEGKDLFSIYVSQADASSFITISQVTPAGLVPFSGDAGSFLVVGPNGPVNVTPDANTGAILLGAKGQATGVPIVSRSFQGTFGVRPNLGRVTAGLQVAPGLDFGKFFFGGTVLGQVIVPGSMGSFYAGNVWTGDARGSFPGGGPVVNGKRVPNFVIGGDLHSLLVAGSIGTDNDALLDQPNFDSGFDMQVGGVLGEVNARDAVLGGVNVIHGRAISPFGTNIEEVEGRNIQSGPPNDATGWANGMLEGGTAVFNDTFATPQILPSYAGTKHRSSVVVNGQLEADPVNRDFVDYYGVPMLAGQDLTVTLRPLGTVAGADNMNVGVFDPDGRLVITDYANVDTDAVTGHPIHFTADRPGLYRIAVAPNGDAAFTIAGGAANAIGNSPYVLTINGGGDLALGGIIATNQIYDAQGGGYGFFVQNGDMGALQAGSNIFSTTDQSIYVRKGNLRSVEGGSIGIANGDPSEGPNLYVTRGNVGLIRSTTGVLNVNTGVLPLAIGGSYQVVSAATTFQATLLANRAIGVIRAGNMATATPSVITANADLQNDDGIIDLIDVAGDVGTLTAGGPAITTGPGGNLRYFNVGGNVFRDAFFGGGVVEPTTYDPGEKVTLRDDSGATMNFTPFPVVRNPAFTPGGTNPATFAPSLTITAYGIRGSGGVAVINLTSTGSVEVGAGGGRGAASHAEIGLLQTTGTGNPVIRNTNDGSLVFSLPTNARDTNSVNLDVLLDGSGTLDVFKVEANSATSIRNETDGEILNIDALGGTIGALSATNIGIGVNHTGAAVNPIQTISNVYPFNQQHVGVVSGNVLNVQASGAVGNLNITGDIGNVTANAGGRHTTGTFEGIAGPIVATGNINSVDIGDGILPSGSGNFSKAGIYAQGSIGTVSNRGLGSDIRGDIVSGSNIGTIALHDGAIIGNKIYVATTFTAAERTATAVVFPDDNDTSSTPTFEIGSISVSGRGGIIGSDIEASDIGDIGVHGGFGILDSNIADQADGTINSIVAEGYGIRGVTVDGGAFLNTMSASAKPKNVSTAEFTPSVLYSERVAIDPFFDLAPSRETDLDLYLGTSARRPQVKHVTDTGVIADTTVTGNRNAGTIFASQIRTSAFDVANQISSIETRGVVEGLQITTGHLKSYYSGDSSFALNFSVAGTIDSVHVNGDVDDTSDIQALGNSAKITQFIVDGTMNGDLSSANNLHELLIGKDLGATSLVKAKTLDIKRIRHNIFGTIQIG